MLFPVIVPSEVSQSVLWRTLLPANVVTAPFYTGQNQSHLDANVDACPDQAKTWSPEASTYSRMYERLFQSLK
ncbi:unnamed protein product [Zymoseptoria tritici ST99CH_3D7]|uniref:Uncharacterized protein n=1 Tax=Zymoseptoria tritici (strain ST99CH_3D7) TaxID=1276538 RepID=A0A1X7RJV8_ZYMT9|nr:unnamed protein product [Zymoseptoria tritici ST99CH_3D7]